MKKLITTYAVFSLIFTCSLYAGQTLNLTVGDTVEAALSGALVSPRVAYLELSLDGTTYGNSSSDVNIGGEGVWAGTYLFDIVKDGTKIADDYKTFCMDLVKSNTFSLETHEVKEIDEDFEWMWGTYYDTLETAADAAAFQLAVWEVVHDDGTDVGSGDFFLSDLFQANNGVTTAQELIDQANNYLTGWTTQANLVMVDDGTNQPFMVQVPAPGAILLGGIGMSLVGWLKRRKTL